MSDKASKAATVKLSLAEEGLEMTADDGDEGPPPVPPSWWQLRGSKPNAAARKTKGSVEQVPDAAPPRPGGFAAFGASQAKGTVELSDSVQRAPIPPPIPDDAVANDDSLDLTRKKQRQNRYATPPPRGPKNQGQPRSGSQDPLPSPFARSSRNRDDIGGAPNSFSSDTMTADVQAMSPYINDADEIIIPEAMAVYPEDIPSAEIVRPDKYSLTVAGRRIRLPFLVLGAILILGATIAAAVTMTKTAVDPGPDALEYRDVPVPSPSGAPSASPFPTSNPSSAPSAGPSTVLRAELMEIISEYSGGEISSSFSDARSKHRAALDWLIDDQTQWRERKEPLPDAELVERFVLALFYFETMGEEWFKSFYFLTNEHVCRWRDYLDRRFKKGVISCTGRRTGMVKNLTLWGNNLHGGLPTEIGLLRELEALHIGMNDIQGEIPSTLGSLTSITHLELNNNDFTGPIDSFSGLSNLKVLDVSSNEMSGPLMNATNLKNLTSIKVNGNRLSGPVPRSFSQISSLETLHLQWNQLTGNVDFFCQDLPSDYKFDCDGNTPEVDCACCVECTFVSDTDCDSETKKLITLDIDAGKDGDDFTWELKEDTSGVIIAADGGYDDGQQLDIQLCLSFPGWYSFLTSASGSTETLSQPHPVNARISFAIDGYESSIGPNEHHSFYVSTPSPTAAPTASPRPTTTTASPTSQISWLIVEPTQGASYQIQEPIIALPFEAQEPPTPCSLFELDLTTDAFGMDTSFEVSDKNTKAVVISESGFESNKTLQFTECLDLSGCYELVIFDDWDDGICCSQGSGSYHVSVNGRMIGSGGEFGSSETTFIGGSCGVNATEGGTCPENHSLLSVTILADWNAYYETSWEVFDASTGQIYATNEYPLEAETSLFAKCIPQKGCYQFTIYDFGDGGAEWNLEYGGAFISSGDGNSESESVSFGPSCGANELV